MNEYTEVSRLAITDISKFILAVICSFASKLFSQENDTVAKAAEEVMQAYRDINTNIEELKRTGNDTAKDTTANSIQLFDKNVATDSSLSPIDKAVYSVLCALANNEVFQCSPKVETIATKASCSQRSVQTSLNTLEKRGLIHRQPRFINHRQISSLYTVIGSKTTSGSVNIPPCDEKNSTCECSIQSNTSYAEEVSNTTEQNTMYFEGRKDEGCIGRNDCTQFSPQDLQSGTQALQSEKTLLESFKDSIRGASLPALTEKDLSTISVTFREEVNSTEETKASLTGGALLPILEDEKTGKPKIPESIPSTSSETQKNPLIRAESDGTATANTTITALQEKPPVRPETTLDASTANVVPTTENAPVSKLSKALLREYEQLRAEYTRDEKPTVETKSVASLLDDVLADIVIKDDYGEAAAPENSSVQACETPVIETEATSTYEHSNPTVASEKPAETPALEVVRAEPVAPDDIPAPNTANSPDEPLVPEMESNPPVKSATHSEPKEAGRKKPGKGKSSGGNPKDRYSPDDAPEVMRPTAEYLLCKTGRKGLRWEEIEILRELSAIHYPTVVNKEIRRACERFEKKNEPLECLTMMYIAVGLRKWRSFGKKKKKELSEEKKKYFAQYEPKKKTEEEKAAILAELRELEASL